MDSCYMDRVWRDLSAQTNDLFEPLINLPRERDSAEQAAILALFGGAKL